MIKSGYLAERALGRDAMAISRPGVTSMDSLNLPLWFRVVLLTAVVALASDAAAQGTGGSTGAIASIPGSVVRDHEQQPGILSLITNPPPPPGADAVAKPKPIRRSERLLPSK
jgi:hypothetical protein